MSDSEPENASLRAGKSFTRPAVPYYPPELKHHYVDMLRRIKAELSRTTGRNVGWQTIRNMIMEPEDKALAAAEEADRARRRAVKATRTKHERDTFLTVEHLKAWDKGAALPSDPRCYFIERFIHRLRKEDKLGDIEHAATRARLNYIKDALFSFYRPDINMAWDSVGAFHWHLDPVPLDVLRHSVFLMDGTHRGFPFATADFLLLFGEVERYVVDVELLALRRSSASQDPVVEVLNYPLSAEAVRPDNTILLYNGFLLLREHLLDADPNRDISSQHWTAFAGGDLILNNVSGATAADLGIDRAIADPIHCSVAMEYSQDKSDAQFTAGRAFAALASLIAPPAGQPPSPLSAKPRAIKRLSADIAAFLRMRDFARVPPT